MRPDQTLSSWKITFSHAFSGMAYIFRTEKSMRVHLGLAAAALLLLALLQASWLEWAIIIIVIGMVISAEILNTAIEVMVDLYCPYYHPLAKISKDVSAAGVLVTAIVSILVGCIVFLPHLWKLVTAIIY